MDLCDFGIGFLSLPPDDLSELPAFNANRKRQRCLVTYLQCLFVGNRFSIPEPPSVAGKPVVIVIVDLKCIRTELGNSCFNAVPENTHCGHDGDDGENADDNSNERQDGSQLVGADGVERHREAFSVT